MVNILAGCGATEPHPLGSIEEAPAAYKSIDRVIDTQVAARMVEVVAKMRPILTFKA